MVRDGFHLLNVLLFSTGNLGSTIYSKASVKLGSLTMLYVEMLYYSKPAPVEQFCVYATARPNVMIKLHIAALPFTCASMLHVFNCSAGSEARRLVVFSLSACTAVSTNVSVQQNPRKCSWMPWLSLDSCSSNNSHAAHICSSKCW